MLDNHPQIKEILVVLKDVFNSIFIAVLIAIILKLFFFQAYFIPSSSMENTLQIGDELLVYKFLYNKRIPIFNIKLPIGAKIKRGDIIVFSSPENNNQDYIKRCIAIEGDRLTFISNKIYLNNKLLKEPYVKNKNVIYNDESYTIPGGYVFVMGDNRNNSSDSRQWGFLSQKKIIGKAFFIYYPFNRMGLLK